MMKVKLLFNNGRFFMAEIDKNLFNSDAQVRFKVANNFYRPTDAYIEYDEITRTLILVYVFGEPVNGEG